jgi:hypothetical protein
MSGGVMGAVGGRSLVRMRVPRVFQRGGGAASDPIVIDDASPTAYRNAQGNVQVVVLSSDDDNE